MFSALSSTLILVGRVLALAAAYFLAGRLALLLAIPPGFATAIFPPLGISLAAILLWGQGLLPGVFLGSLLLNTSIAIGNGAPFNLATLGVSSEIATGSCLAAWIGALLIKRFVKYPNDLTDEWSIFAFFMLGGPLTSCISATIGVGALLVNSVISPSSFVNSWLTWWTGDSIGVLIGTPFVFILYGKPRELWRNRVTGVGIPLLISLILIVAIFFSSSNSEQQKIQRTFQSSAQEISLSIFKGFQRHITALVPLKGLYLASDNVTSQDFKLFTEGLLNDADGISALSWNELVPQDAREKFELRMRGYGYSNFFISERNNNGGLVPAQEHERYVVVTYIEPYLENSTAQGFNVASDAVRNQALVHANSTGKSAMTAPLKLVQDAYAGYGYLIFLPVYNTSETPRTLPLREKLLRGYVTALFSVDNEIKKIHQSFPISHFQLTVEDIDKNAKSIIIYKDSAGSISPYMSSFLFKVKKTIAGREILISVLPTEKFIDENRGMQSWYVLVGGLLFCSLLGGFLLLVTGRAQRVAALVDQRTLELESILNEAVEAIIICDQDGRIERANPAACQLFSYQYIHLIGLYASAIVPVLNDLNNFKETDTVNMLSSKCLWKSLETFGIANGGTHIPIEIGVNRVELPSRHIYTCIIHDVTARKRVDRLKSEFISTVSHELRTPLTSISGVLGLLIGGSIPEIPTKAMDLLIIAKKNALRLGRLVNDILDIEKLEFGQLQLELVECEVNQLIGATIEQNAGYAIKYGVHLALDNEAIVGHKIIIRVDSDRFLQVMSNLISNAVKYSNLDGIVTVSVKLDNNFIIFSVEDNGAGIPDEFRNRIFQKFAQADSSDTRKREGTGLGLSITRIIVERMGGVINYQSQVNKGSVFYFSLPIYKIEPLS